MKQRTARIVDAVLLVTMMVSATLAVFVCPEHTGLIMLFGFWPEFAAHVFIQRKYYV